jgi:hypothetical protein
MANSGRHWVLYSFVYILPGKNQRIHSLFPPTAPLAAIVVESPEAENFIFPDAKKRPEEALFVSWKN